MLVQRPINARALAMKTGHHRSLNGPSRTRGYRHPSADGGPPHVQNAAREADSEYQTLDQETVSPPPGRAAQADAHDDNSIETRRWPDAFGRIGHEVASIL